VYIVFIDCVTGSTSRCETTTHDDIAACRPASLHTNR